MGQAKRYRHRRLVHVGAIGRKVIVAQHRGAGVAQEVFQDLATSGGGDMKHRKGGRAKHPGPQQLPLVFVARLVDVVAADGAEPRVGADRSAQGLG